MLERLKQKSFEFEANLESIVSWRSDYEGKTLSKKVKAQTKKKTPAYTPSIYDSIGIGPGVHWLKVMLFQKTEIAFPAPMWQLKSVLPVLWDLTPFSGIYGHCTM